MKKIAIGATVALTSAFLVASPANADVTAVSTSYCTITVPSQIVWSDTRRVPARNRVEFSAITCPAGVTTTKDNLDSGRTIDPGEWHIVDSGFPFTGNVSSYQSIQLEIPSVEIDPWTGEVLGAYTDSAIGSMDVVADYKTGIYTYLEIYVRGTSGSYDVYGSGENQNFIAFNNGGTVTNYPLKLSNPIVSKYESTVSVKAKKSGSTVTLKVTTSRNRWTETKGGAEGSAYGIIKAYKGDVVKIYRDGKKIATKKVPLSGKVTVRITGQSGKHDYQVVLPENTVNFEGSATVRK